jgi:predicted nucleic acid-binding protein
MSLVMSVAEIIAAALKLDPKTRWRVIEKIADSLEEDRIPVEDVEALWLEEAARRARELREGKAAAWVGIPTIGWPPRSF